MAPTAATNAPSQAASTGAEAPWAEAYEPTKLDMSFHDVLHALNPLQHVPGVGTIYRAATDDEIPIPLKVLGAGVLGGPLGMVGAALFGLVGELFRLGPDHSRPPVPAGFTMGGSEAGPVPVSPGTAPTGSYLTLATTQPAFLQPDPGLAERGQAAYASVMENRFSQGMA